MTAMRSFSAKKALFIAAIAGLAYGVGSRSRGEDRHQTPSEKKKVEKRREKEKKAAGRALANPSKIVTKQSRKAAKYTKNSAPGSK